MGAADGSSCIPDLGTEWLFDTIGAVHRGPDALFLRKNNAKQDGSPNR